MDWMDIDHPDVRGTGVGTFAEVRQRCCRKQRLSAVEKCSDLTYVNPLESRPLVPCGSGPALDSAWSASTTVRSARAWSSSVVVVAICAASAARLAAASRALGGFLGPSGSLSPPGRPTRLYGSVFGGRSGRLPGGDRAARAPPRHVLPSAGPASSSDGTVLLVRTRRHPCTPPTRGSRSRPHQLRSVLDAVEMRAP
jgi:hypothetical protein